MGRVNYLEEIKKISDKLPPNILQCINNNCASWLAWGGSPDDSYIEFQLRTAENYIKEVENETR